MEKKMEQYANELFERDSLVKGVACADERGAALYARGTLTGRSAAFSSQLAQLAAGLEPSLTPAAIIVTGTDDTRIIIKKQGTIVVAVHRAPSLNKSTGLSQTADASSPTMLRGSPPSLNGQ